VTQSNPGSSPYPSGGWAPSLRGECPQRSCPPSSQPVPGLFTLVLHTHLPWLAHHGRWPVGEEWLYQSWSAAYLPLMRVLRTLAGEERRHVVTLGMTPVVTAQLDDPYCLSGMHHLAGQLAVAGAGGHDVA